MIFRLLLINLALLICHSSFSQTYNFEHYNVEEGLSQSSVSSIVQDSRGYLWIGTYGGGICKFDGISFTQYNEKHGISGNIVTDLCIDRDENLWITSTWDGVTQYNGRNFVVYTKDDGLLGNGNNKIHTDSKGRLWIGNNSGLVTYENGIFKRKDLGDRSYTNSRVNCIEEDSKGHTWVGTENGILLISKDNVISISASDGLPSDTITSIKQDNDGNFYIGTNKGLTKLLSGSIDEKRDFEFDHQVPFDNIGIRDILIEKSGEIWIASNENGLYIIDMNNRIMNITKKNGLITNSLTKLFQDRNGNMWIGTNGAGLVKYAHKAFTYFNNIAGLNNPGIFGITSDEENNIWVSTTDEGIFKYDGVNSYQFTDANGLGSNTVRASICDNKGNLWFGTSKGLTKYKDGVFRTYTISDGLPSNNIRSLMFDNEENIWIGTYGEGLSVFNYSKFTNYTTRDGLSHNFIHSLFQDSKGNIWIGTGNGAIKYSDGTFTSFSDSEGFCNLYVGSITEDKYGNIWFGTDRCAVRYDGLEFKAITVDDGLSSGVVYLLKGDANGNIWVGTNSGIDKIYLDAYGQIERIKNYGSKQGFRGVECNSRSVFEDAKGNLWIGTVKGLVKYNPKEDRTNVFEPSIHINNIKLFFENVNWLNYSKDLTKWNNLPTNLVLYHDKNHLTFEFSAINLSFPEDVLYRFKLTPFDDQWFNATDKTSATYSNLPPGEYTFSVRAGNEDGVWNQEPATYSFRISSPWWKRWWLIVPLSIAIFYIMFKLASFKEKQQLEISRELEKKVKERTIQIEKQRDEKEILLKEIHHRVKNNMQVITSLLSIQSGYTKDEKAIALFNEAKNRIRSMALIHEKMYQTEDLAFIDFQDYIMALTDDLIRTYSINCNIFLDIKIDNVRFGIDTLIPLGLLFNEIVSNTLKYAFKNVDKGKITIHLSHNEKENNYILNIGDNGIGMPKEAFERKEGSLGIELIKIFVSQLDGTITRINKEGTFYKIIFRPRA